MREGMVGVHDLRRQDGRDGGFKILAHELDFGLGQLVIVQLADAVHAQLLFDLLIDLLTAGVEHADGLIDVRQLLAGCPAALLVDGVRLEVGTDRTDCPRES